MNNSHFAVRCKLGQTIQHKQLLSIGNLRQPRRETTKITFCRFLFNGLLFTLPVNSEWRIADNILEGVAAELIVRQGVTKSHVVRITTTDHHIRFGNCESGGIELLSKTGNFNILVQIVDTLLHAGQHLAGAHGHIVDSYILCFCKVGIGEQEVSHQIDNIPAGEVRSGFLSKGFREPLYQVFKDVPAVNSTYFVRAEIALWRRKLLDDKVEGVALHHSLDDVVKIEFGQNILDIGREPSQIVPEVGFDVIRVSQQLFKCELAGIVELITGSLGQKAINDGQLLDLFILCQDCFVGGKQTVVETLNHGHRKDYKPVLMGLKGATEHICHIPDHRCFFCNIYSYRLDFIVRHRVYLDSYFLYALAWVPSSGSRPIMKSVSKIAFREAFLLG